MTSSLSLPFAVSLAIHSLAGIAYVGWSHQQHGTGTAAVFAPREDQEIEVTLISAVETLAEPAPESPKEMAALSLPAPLTIPKPIVKSVTKFTRKADAPPPKATLTFTKPASKAPSPSPTPAKPDAPTACTGQCVPQPSAVSLATQKGPESAKPIQLASAASATDAGTPDIGSALGSLSGTPNGSPDGIARISGATVQYRRNPPPAYPKRALQRHTEGTVLLEVLVRTDGLPGEVKIKESSGSSILDDAALESVKHWEFEPASVQGQTIKAWAEVPVRFYLKPASGK